MNKPAELKLETVPVWINGEAISPSGRFGEVYNPATGQVTKRVPFCSEEFIDQAIKRHQEKGELNNREDLKQAIMEGAALRVRPLAMTVAVIIGGLLPIMLGGGTGSEVMQRIAAPMVGGMISAPLLSMFVVPAAYFLMRTRLLKPR